MAVLEWLVRLLNVSFEMEVVPMDWRIACIVSLYKGKSDKCECINLSPARWTLVLWQSADISLLIPTSLTSRFTDPDGKGKHR